MPPFILNLIPDEGLTPLLPKKYRDKEVVEYPLTRRTSIKDIVEALRIPHTEVGSIFCKDQEIPFDYIPIAGQTIHLHSLPPGTDVSRPTLLRPPLQEVQFLVDINVGKLARLLRMAGFDARYEPQWQEEELAETAAWEGRILLSRNRDLLRRKCVHWGHLLRSQEPEEQLREVLIQFGLKGRIKPFIRCMQCNSLLQPVKKSSILHRLEPLTRKYYQSFYLCPACDQIYWRGSHHKKMEELIEKTYLGI